MNVTLKINTVDISNRLSTYIVTNEINYNSVLTTLDGTEHPYPGMVKPIVTFSLIPGTWVEDQELYNELSKLLVTVEYMYLDAIYTRQMRVTSNIESKFLLLSVDGKRRYKSGEITLRGL